MYTFINHLCVILRFVVTSPVSTWWTMKCRQKKTSCQNTYEQACFTRDTLQTSLIWNCRVHFVFALILQCGFASLSTVVVYEVYSSCSPWLVFFYLCRDSASPQILQSSCVERRRAITTSYVFPCMFLRLWRTLDLDLLALMLFLRIWLY